MHCFDVHFETEPEAGLVIEWVQPIVCVPHRRAALENPEEGGVGFDGDLLAVRLERIGNYTIDIKPSRSEILIEKYGPSDVEIWTAIEDFLEEKFEQSD